MRLDKTNQTPAMRGKTGRELIVHICVLCGNGYNGMGNNPYPLSHIGRCCNDCNTNRVVPTRIANMQKAERDAERRKKTPEEPIGYTE